MISELNVAKANYLNTWIRLTDEDRQKGIPSTQIAEWIDKDVNFVDILMKLIGYKKVVFEWETYWFEPTIFNRFTDSIQGYLL